MCFDNFTCTISALPIGAVTYSGVSFCAQKLFLPVIAEGFSRTFILSGKLTNCFHVVSI